MKIELNDILPIAAPEQYKLHFARKNTEGTQPLDVWVRDQNRFQDWQEYRPARDDFNRPFIFSLAQFYHEEDVWLFTGVFRVLERHPDRYKVEMTAEGAGLVGRLKLRSPYRGRPTRVNFENHYPAFEVFEVVREPYSGRAFPGFEGIELSFEELEVLVRTSRPDWKSALKSVKGIYLLSDEITGKRYVGSAYGEGGVWSRWCEYVATRHAGNVELRALVTDSGLDYYRKAVRFALLEYRPAPTSDEVILKRESFWKMILLTRGQQGLNRN